MYYDKEELEKIRNQGEEFFRQQEKEAQGYQYNSAAGLQIYCSHCKYDRFEKGKALLNTRGLSFLDLDWLNADAITLVCKRCGFIHWFMKDAKVNNDK